MADSIEKPKALREHKLGAVRGHLFTTLHIFCGSIYLEPHSRPFSCLSLHLPLRSDIWKVTLRERSGYAGPSPFLFWDRLVFLSTYQYNAFIHLGPGLGSVSNSEANPS